MSDTAASGGIPLTVYLSADLAKRLQAAATAKKCPAGAVVIDLLQRYLPRVQGDGAKPGNIPYA